MPIHINDRIIGPEHAPYVVAEMSANHQGKLSVALQLLDEAKKAGADAVKLQSYTPDTITLPANSEEFTIRGGLWDGRTLYDLYQEAHMPWDWHKPLFDHAHAIGITLFSSPFDRSAVDLLENLNAPAYKIASFEAVDLALIRYAASTRKPLIISTGMADADEIGEAIAAARDGGCEDLVVLHCVSGYPAPAHDYNLRTLSDIGARFGVLVGLSDHTLDNTTAIASVALGACVIEKHVTLSRLDGGPDSSFSLEPAELAALCQGARTAWSALGCVSYARQASEKANAQFRRSLYFVKDLQAGDLITEDAIRSVRPGFGLAPKYLRELIGKRVPWDVKKYSPTSAELLSRLRAAEPLGGAAIGACPEFCVNGSDIKDRRGGLRTRW